ncbi:hypothetical protein HU200_041588 [Digitaria exilis]|uniref:PWI domain-containing protein n=1 Tax=Digitaria exilis TaxID=1010633 RepID=A0A835B7J2_9POAL|nr:hypothetical protein HU200_041588 [Digitaria exilis]CAB3448252.1 unnamed protein product [Digitaria exilis]
MASDAQLCEWVSDKLMILLGYSKGVIVQYVNKLAKECSSAGDLVAKLVEFGFTSSVETHTFAADICAKVPRKASGISNYQKQERDAAMLVQKQSTADEGDNDAGNQTSTSRKGSTIPLSKGQKQFRRKADQDGGEDDGGGEDEKVAKDSGRNVRRRTEEDDEKDGDNSSDEEKERMRDSKKGPS